MQSFNSRYFLEKNRSMWSYKYSDNIVCSGFIFRSPNLQTTQMLINRWTGKQAVGLATGLVEGKGKGRTFASISVSRRWF